MHIDIETLLVPDPSGQGPLPPLLVLRLARPQRANAYDQAMLEALEEALDRGLAQGPGALIVEAAGEGAFCGGADLDELARARPEQALDLRSQRLFDRIARAPVPSIAAVHGPAIAGGFELALACDLRLVGPRARFGLPELGLGLVPSAGGTTRLRQLCGPAIARQVILAGQEIDAQAAVTWGLALPIVPDPRAAARQLGARLCARDPLAMRLARELLRGEDDARGLFEERMAEAILYARRARP